MDSGHRTRVFWTLAVVSVALAIAVGLALSHTTEMDFFVYRYGGSHVVHPSLYSARVPSTAGPLLFTYPPFAALLFWPFSRIPLGVGELIWNTMNVVSLWAAITASFRAAVGRKLTQNEWCFATALTLPALFLWPVRDNLVLGQIELILLAMILLDFFVPLRVGKYAIPQGVLIGAAAAVKLTPFIFVAYLAITGRRAAARNATISFLIAAALMCAVAPMNSITYWTHDVLATQRIAQPLSAGNEALHGLLPRLGLFLPSASMDLVSIAALVLGLVIAERVGRRFGMLPGVLVCAAVGLIVSPISWTQHYVWIIPAICWIAASNLRMARKISVLAVLVVIFGSHPSWLEDQAPIRGNFWFFLQADTYVLAAIAFVALMAVLLVRSKRATVDDRLALAPAMLRNRRRHWVDAGSASRDPATR